MLTVRQRSNGKFQAMVRVKRDGQIIHSESRTFETERLANDWGERTNARIAAGGVVTRRAELTTLGSLIDRYRTELARVKPLHRSRVHELAQLEQSWIGQRSLAELDSAKLVRWAAMRQAEGAGPTTILHNLSTIRAVLGAAKPMFGLDIRADVAVDAIAALRRVGAAAPSVSRDRRLQAGEEDALMAEFARVATHPSTFIPMEKIVRVALAWPRRREELCEKVTWEGLDQARHVAVLKDTKNPTKVRNEVVPVPREAWAIMQSMPKVDARVFPFEPQSVSKAFERVCGRLGIKDLRFHDLRHEGICRLFEAGLTIPEVCIISGHLSWSALQRYTHLRPEKVLEKLDARPQA